MFSWLIQKLRAFSIRDKKKKVYYGAKYDPNSNHIAQTGLLISLLLAFVLALSYPFYKNEFETFYPQILAEAHGMVFDLFVVGVLVYWIDRARERRRMASYYMEEVEDLATVGTAQAGIKASALIKRLNRLGITKMHLNGIVLAKANILGCDFTDSSMLRTSLSGSKADRSQFTRAFLNSSDFTDSVCNSADFSSAYALNVNFSRSFCIRTNFENAVLITAIFDNAYLMEANFEGAILIRASFKDASLSKCNFKNTTGLTPEMIREAKTYEGAIFNEDFEKILAEYERLSKFSSLTVSELL